VRARNRELLALIPAAVLVTGGFSAILIQSNEGAVANNQVISNGSLTYGLLFLGLCLAAHIVLRITLPHADPYLFPLVAVLACFGLVMIYRIDEDLARKQATYFVVGLVLFVVTIVGLRDYRKLEQYRYVIAAASILLLFLPRVPGLGQQTNGAYLGIKFPLIGAFQPAEFAKVGIVIFLAAYLRDTRQVLVQGARRFMGVTLPPVKHFGPLLVVWGSAMLLLVFIRDLGSSLMFFGAFLAILYVATSRLSFVTIGLAMFGFGVWFFTQTVGHIQGRIDAWLHPFDPKIYDAVGGSFQVAQSLFAQADGGLFGQGFGQALLDLPRGGQLLPAAQTDLIYAVITNELGLFGACAVLLTYLLVCERGFKTALLARDSFSTLLATGLTAVFALQVFVIVGGVTRVIPLTGVTLPFVSYGGSSLIANFVLLALLLLVSDRARRPVSGADARRTVRR
jgi:cell division protein FtsW (lipid II flippase)